MTISFCTSIYIHSGLYTRSLCSETPIPAVTIFYATVIPVVVMNTYAIFRIKAVNSGECGVMAWGVGSAVLAGGVVRALGFY
jgi:hypothetical protein